MRVNSSRLMVRHAAGLLDEGEASAAGWCAMAKVHATDACFGAANDALQLFGGYG